MDAEEGVLEIQGGDVEKAIQAGLAQLNLSREDVEVEVLDEGSSGFLGIGGRDAMVQLRVKKDASPTMKAPVVDGDVAAQESKEVGAPAIGVHEARKTGEEAEQDEDTPPEDEVAEEIVSTLLQKMHIESTITMRQTEPDDLTGERRWIVDVRGQDMGVLIGPRGETLNSLQYISRLMAGHMIRRRPKFIVDVEGYRTRREQALARLAERMADKVARRGHPMSLEPMPPNERRIIHITLRENESVYTESSGEGPRRKVIIYPKS